MTKEQAIEMLRYNSNVIHKTINGKTDPNEVEALEMAIKALEQQPSDDKVTITMDKGTLKYSGHGYVVYNKDWFRKHFAMEVKIMTGYDGYIEQQPSEDCVSRVEVLNLVRLNAFHVKSQIKAIENMPPVTPTFPKGATNGDMIKAMFNCMVIAITNGKVYVEKIYFPFNEDWWNAPYKGVENGSN